MPPIDQPPAEPTTPSAVSNRRPRRLHVATVHWRDDRWIDPQLAYLDRNAGMEHRVYAFLNHIDPATHRGRFELVLTEPIESHAVKLNLLAELIAHMADPDDLILFLDGDAFPVADVAAYALPLLERFPLLAVRRSENHEDPQPHPCFCVTTVGFWREIDGDWREGHSWTNPLGEAVTDVGGNLLGILERRGIPWYPILRSNAVDVHPLWFGLYGDVAYHHGAAFRPKISRLDYAGIDAELRSSRLYGLYRRLPEAGPMALIRRRLKVHRHRHGLIAQYQHRNRLLSERIFNDLRADPSFFRRFREVDGDAATPAPQPS